MIPVTGGVVSGIAFVGTDFGGEVICVPLGDGIGDGTITGGCFFGTFGFVANVSV